MSDLSVFLHRVGAFLRTPAVVNTPGVSDAAAKISDAATAIEGVLPSLAKAGVDAALASAGPLGLASTPFVNNFIDLLIAELTARKTPAPAPALVNVLSAVTPQGAAVTAPLAQGG